MDNEEEADGTYYFSEILLLRKSGKPAERKKPEGAEKTLSAQERRKSRREPNKLV